MFDPVGKVIIPVTDFFLSINVLNYCVNRVLIEEFRITPVSILVKIKGRGWREHLYPGP